MIRDLGIVKRGAKEHGERTGVLTQTAWIHKEVLYPIQAAY